MMGPDRQKRHLPRGYGGWEVAQVDLAHGRYFGVSAAEVPEMREMREREGTGGGFMKAKGDILGSIVHRDATRSIYL